MVTTSLSPLIAKAEDAAERPVQLTSSPPSTLPRQGRMREEIADWKVDAAKAEGATQVMKRRAEAAEAALATAKEEAGRLRAALEKIEQQIERANMAGDIFVIRQGDKAANVFHTVLALARAALSGIKK